MPENKFNLPELEEKILKFWEEHRVFEKTLERSKNKKPFVFYEGPPTANGLPHIGHALTRAFKDIILRYKTMRGFFVPRKAGWDTHGLPVEIEVEKTLGFKRKQDIETYGIARFNQKAKESVWKYKDEWEKMTRRLGFWIDLKNPYITYETSYIETLWWIMKEIWKKGILKEDFKVVPWCSRCGTGLSSHELGLGYKKVKENSIYVKFKVRNKKNEYLLVWTTTPWTLPGNVAIAAHPKLEYGKYKIRDEYIWSMSLPPHDAGEEAQLIEKVAGRTLVGIQYDPLFSMPKECSLGTPPPYHVLPAEFISEEGAGFVHLAPAFGEDDLSTVKSQMMSGAALLGGKEVPYPLIHTVNPDGTMKKGVIGEGKFVKDADAIIIEDLKRRKLLQWVQPYEHEYPFCWRCGTPLIYFAKKTWWVHMRALKDTLIRSNSAIHWIPGHIQEGRFGEFLRDLRDWAFSRERYWGTPLPIWRCQKCLHEEAIGSLQELQEKSERSKNVYIGMRHGESRANISHIISQSGDRHPLTLRGRIQVEKTARRLKKMNIDIIFASPIRRTKETAEIVARVLQKKMLYDPRLREIQTGVLDGHSAKEYHNFFASPIEKFSVRPPGGENLSDVRSRMIQVIQDMEQKHKGKTILFISHEYPIWMMYSGAIGLSNEDALMLYGKKQVDGFMRFADIRTIPYYRMPRDEKGEVNLHRPYVDAFWWGCKKCGGMMRRVPELADVWFDSGAMPFAGVHYPFVPKQKIPFPADYICEAMDQTRGWFYTLLAVSTLLGKGAPYKNVISLGHVLDKNGQKMSKSKGNVIDPGQMIAKYGADTLRWFFYTVNAPGDTKRFDEADMPRISRGFLGTFWNSFMLLDTYVERVSLGGSVKSPYILDQWILAKLQSVAFDVSKKLDQYDIINAARVIESFAVSDFSQWFLRRSRRRLQHPKSEKEKMHAANTAAEVLLGTGLISAPFIPFLSEAVYQGLRKKAGEKEESIHLFSWPKTKIRESVKTKNLFAMMDEVRRICSEALRLRASAGIKTRQPLQELKITNLAVGEARHGRQELIKNNQFLEIIKDEVNVKSVVWGDVLALDTTITPELKEEGIAREFIRNVQEMRKDLGLKPAARIRCQIQGDRHIEDILFRWQKIIQKDTNAKSFIIGGKKVFSLERDITIDDKELWTGIDTI